MADSPEVELIGVWEPDAERRAAASGQAAYAGVRWLDAAEEALSDPTVEGDVSGASPGRNARSAPASTCGWTSRPA